MVDLASRLNGIFVVDFGGLPFGLSKEGFYTGTSKPVNNRLFNIFITCDFTEQSGHGIPRIVDHYGREAFSFNDGILKVTIPYGYVPDYVLARQARNKIIDILTDNQRNVLHYLAENPYTSLQAVADSCSLSLGGVKKIVGKLQEMELLERKGPKNNPQWIVR